MNEHFLDNRWRFPSFPRIKSTCVPFTDQLQLSSCCKWEETVKVLTSVEMQKRYLLIVLGNQKTTICNSNVSADPGSLWVSVVEQMFVLKSEKRSDQLTQSEKPPLLQMFMFDSSTLTHHVHPLWPSCLRTWRWPQELITLPFEPTSGASQSPLEKHPIFLLLQHILKADITSPVKQHLRTVTSVTQI